MEEKINTSKIVIEDGHELTDVVRNIHKSKAERIILTFTDHTDLLISPINLRVLQETATREGKLLIAQIIQNPTGIRNSKLAGIKVIDSPSNPTEDDWRDAFEISESKRKEILEKKKEKVSTQTSTTKTKESFEERVNTAISKKQNGDYIDRRGVKSEPSFISIDQDLHQEEEVNPEVAGKDFSSLQNVAINNVTTPLPRKEVFELIKNIKLDKKKVLKLVLFVLLPLLLISGSAFAVYNQIGTVAKVKIFVESKPVEVEMIFTGKEGIEEIDFENLEIPIKKEEATKSLSDSITATGKAFRGTKAKGVVKITYYLGESCTTDTPKIVLGAGHIVSTTEYSYKLTTGVELTCNLISDDITVEAVEIGEQYNIPSGKSFSIQNQPKVTVYALNAAAFTGGTKEEYTVLSQQDVDNAVEQLSTTAIEEVKSELRESGKGWAIIEDTIISAVDKASIKTDKSVGAEASIVNLDLTIKGTATYYFTDNLNEGLTTILREEAEDKNLFESDNDVELVLGDEIDKSLTVEESDKDVVKIKLVAKSTIKPKIEKTVLENTLRGMAWDEGINYINNLKYAERKAVITFLPQKYPTFLKRFPDRKGGVMIEIQELEVQE